MRRAAPPQRGASVSKAVADGGSCRQLACGRETVCQRDRSILKSPVTLARPERSACHFPQSAGPPGACSFALLRPGLRGPSRTPGAGRKMPVGTPLVNPQWRPDVHRVRPACPWPLPRSRTGLESRGCTIPPRRFQFVNHEWGLQTLPSLCDGVLRMSSDRQLAPPELPGVPLPPRYGVPHGSISQWRFTHLRDF